MTLLVYVTSLCTNHMSFLPYCRTIGPGGMPALPENKRSQNLKTGSRQFPGQSNLGHWEWGMCTLCYFHQLKWIANNKCILWIHGDITWMHILCETHVQFSRLHQVILLYSVVNEKHAECVRLRYRNFAVQTQKVYVLTSKSSQTSKPRKRNSLTGRDNLS